MPTSHFINSINLCCINCNNVVDDFNKGEEEEMKRCHFQSSVIGSSGISVALLHSDF